MFCPQCQSEYVEGIAECAECHVPLVASLPSEEIPEYENFQVVRMYTTRYDAELGKSILEANDVDVELIQESVGHSAFPVMIDGLGRVQIFVSKKKLREARELLKEFTEGSNLEE